MMPASVAAALLHRLAIDGSEALAHFSRDARRRLSHALVEWPLPVVGSRGYNYAEATAGGVALAEIDPATMESRVCPGLFLRRRDPRRRRPDRRVQFPVGVVDRLRRRRAASPPPRFDTSALPGPTLTFMRRPFLFWGFKSSAARSSKTRLGSLEREVMAVVWNHDEISVRDACARLGSSVAYTTVMTTMDRLFKKGLLARRKIGPRVSSIALPRRARKSRAPSPPNSSRVCCSGTAAGRCRCCRRSSMPCRIATARCSMSWSA